MASDSIDCALRVRSPDDRAARFDGFGDITQASVVTDDLDTAAATLSAALGAGRFKVVTMDAPQLFDRRYGGEPESWAMRLGVTWIGGMQLEIIEPTAGRSVFADYLHARGGRSGIQHIFLESSDWDWATTRLEQAGYPLEQRARMNAAGRLGWFPMPALPKFLAPKFAAHFGYTRSFEPLGVDIEVAKFPPGVSQRLALRAAIVQQWIPEAEGRDDRLFEKMPADACIADIDGLVIACTDLDGTAQAYGALTNDPPSIEPFDGAPFPGRGRLANIRAKTTTVTLVQAEDGPLATLAREQGPGVVALRARPARNPAHLSGALAERGWEQRSPTLFEHHSVPFALTLQG